MIFFFIASLLGTLMRLMFVTEIPINYKHVLHAHSHTAMHSWAYPMVSGALLFFGFGTLDRKRLLVLLGLNLLAGIGMAVSFMLQGYGPVSIAFSVVHLISAYLFALSFLRKSTGNRPSDKFARWSVIWMIISTSGLLAIGPVSQILGNNHPVFYASIQFFLHFQFNGWFTYAILALLLKLAEKIRDEPVISVPLFWTLQISLLLTYALSITWSTPETILFYLNSTGVLLQLVAVGIILYKLWNKLHGIQHPSSTFKTMLFLGMISLAAKIIAQSLAAVPAIAEISYTIRNFVIGFIHLTMLGSITLTAIALAVYFNYLPVNKLARVGYAFLIAAFFSTEVILFGQGILLWAGMGFIQGYYVIIFSATCLFPLSLGLLTIAEFNKTQTLILKKS